MKAKTTRSRNAMRLWKETNIAEVDYIYRGEKRTRFEPVSYFSNG